VPEDALSDNIAINAVQMDNWLTLAQVAQMTGRSEKSIRRYIKQGRLDKSAVHAEKTLAGFRYRIEPQAVEALKQQLNSGTRTYSASLEHIGSKLDEGLDRVAQRFEEAVQPLREQVASLARALPPAEEERTKLTATIRRVDEETKAVRECLDSISDQLGELVSYQRALLAWEALPWLKRRRIPKPKPPRDRRVPSG